MEKGKSMKKLLILLLTILCVGCSQTPKIQLNKPITLDYFYLQSCGGCKAFEKTAVKKLESTFGDQITINTYDLDNETSSKIYDVYVDQLEDFDQVFYGQGPFIVVEDYFAVIGYNSGEVDDLISDIVNITNDQPLSETLKLRRYLFK